MSQQQYTNTVEQWNERQFREEVEARRLEDANAVLQEMQDAEFREEIEAKFPILKGWK